MLIVLIIVFIYNNIFIYKTLLKILKHILKENILFDKFLKALYYYIIFIVNHNHDTHMLIPYYHDNHY
jgi:hypothetical protein